MAKINVLFVFLLLSFTAFSQKKGSRSDIVRNPSGATRPLSVTETEIRRRVGEDRRTVNRTEEKNEGLEKAPTNLSISLDVFKSQFPSIQKFYISKNALIDLLYNPQVDPKDEISGFWVLFTQKQDEIVLVRAKTIDNNNLKFSDDYETINTKTSYNTVVRDLTKPTLKEIQKGFKGSNVKGYFIGRTVLVGGFRGSSDRGLVDGTNFFQSDFLNLEIDIRKNAQNQYALILSKNNSKIPDSFLGVAYYSERIFIGGSSTSRPCPSTCPD
jgi:hypothetical protein